jgi:hypothetical protein
MFSVFIPNVKKYVYLLQFDEAEHEDHYYSRVMNNHCIDAITYQSCSFRYIAIIYISIHQSGFAGLSVWTLKIH